MKTPDDIKKGLAVCATLDGDCENCPYDDGKQLTCVDRSRRDALAYIIQLETRLAQAERERDAALKDIANTCWSCGNAKPSQLSKFLYSCPHLKGKAGVRTQCEHWQWRGVCAENTKDDSSAHSQ